MAILPLKPNPSRRPSIINATLETDRLRYRGWWSGVGAACPAAVAPLRPVSSPLPTAYSNSPRNTVVTASTNPFSIALAGCAQHHLRDSVSARPPPLHPTSSLLTATGC
jgi:hypothetical protein